MSSFTYSGEVDERIPDDTECLTIAETVQALPVQFKFCFKYIHLQKVVLSSGLCCIPNQAFQGCKALREVVMPPTVTAIGKYAFSGCTSLAEFTFPEGLQILGSDSFASCAFTHLRIPASLEVIEDSTFEHCDSLLNVELFDGLKVIGLCAFESCSRLREIRLPSTVEVIAYCAFGSCYSLEIVDFPNGLKQIGKSAYSFAKSLQSVAIPSSVEHIEENAFEGCFQLKVLNLEQGLETIGASAFRRCSSLLRVSVPKTVNTIGDNAFESCRSLRDVVLVDGSLRSIGANAFASCSMISIWIPSSVDYVGDRAFYQSLLISAEIPQNSSTTFGGNAFSECQWLANIALPPLTTQDEILDHCEVLNDAYGSTNVIQGIKSRFRGYPVHEACYYAASTMESDEMLVRALRMQGETNAYLENLIDPLGMTPFHVLMSAAKKRSDILKLLLEVYPSNVLGFTCPRGHTALGFLVLNWTTESSTMLRLALHKWMIDGMQRWGLSQWRSNMSALVESIFNCDLNTIHRFFALEDACKKMGRYEMMESTSLLELWLWKMKMQSMRNGAKRMAVDRETSRGRCGATFVLPTVVDFLQVPDEDSDEDY